MLQITAKQAPQLITDALRANLVPMICSSPGMGKSSIASQIAKENNLQLIDVRLSQCDPTDLNGFPHILKGEDGQPAIATYIPMDTFPTEHTELPAGKDGWLLLMDELNSAPMSVQAAAYKIVLDRMVGQHNLHPKCKVMAAGNLATDKAIVNRLSTAMQSRMLHLEMRSDPKGWLGWALENNIDHRVTSYIAFRPEALNNFDPGHQDKTFACERTWDFVSRLIKQWPTIEPGKMALLAGTIGAGVASDFSAFCEIYQDLPSIEQIIANPESFNIVDQPNIKYALSGLIASHIDGSNIEPLFKAIERLPIEFQVITLQGSIKKNQTILGCDSVKKWLSANARNLL